jgi:hypothetical protein
MPQVQLTQNAYIVGVTKQTIISDIFKDFYTLINKHVNPKGSATKFWYPVFPYKNIFDGKLDYPIGTIDSPTISWEKFTITKKWAMGQISFSVFSTKSSEADDLLQDVINGIDAERKTFWNLNVRKVNLDATSADHLTRDEVKIHIRSATFTFQYPFTHGLFQ